MSIGDSLYNGTGFYDITSAEPHPILTPQNGVAFVHLFLLWAGLDNPDNRLLAIKIINYLGFLCFILVFYRIFTKLKVSSEITILCLGIILSSAFFMKTILAPVNEGFLCFLAALICYLVINYESNNSYLILGLIAFLSIVIANVKLNGPLIILAASLTYLLLKKQKKALIFLIIFFISCASIYALLEVLRVDFSNMRSLVKSTYTQDFYLDKIIMINIYTIPGVFLGISGRKMMIALPISITILIYFIIYFRQSMREKRFIKIYSVVYIILSIMFLFIANGNDSRFIIMVFPFTLLTIATFYKNTIYLRVSLCALLLFTLSISCYRIFFWDIHFFKNNQSMEYVKKNIMEPFTLISESPRYSYYIFNKRADNIDKITFRSNPIIVFGNSRYIDNITRLIKNTYKVVRIENMNTKFMLAHGEDEMYNVTKIVLE
jgi:hypothetical protein